MVRAYGWSIYGMLAMPFLIASSLGFLLWRASRAGPAPRPGEPPTGEGPGRSS